MTIHEYMDNPMGKGNAAFNLKLLQDSMNTKYRKYVEKKGKLIKVHSYVTAKGEYYIHMVLPSETERDNTYDVVFHFYDPEKKFVSSKSVRDYEVHMFSNDPSFAYTYAYAYNENGLLYKELIGKLGREFITKRPVVRNRFEVTNYNKYLFFGAKYLLENLCLTRAYLTTHATTFLFAILDKRVRTLTTIMSEYNKALLQLRKETKYAATQEKHAERTKQKRERKEPKSSVHKVPKVPKKGGGRKTHQVNKITKK